MSVYLYKSGLVFEDIFDSTHPRWVLSPSTKGTINETLTLNHSEEGTTAMFDIPDYPNLMFEVRAQYLPVQPGDEGGIIIYKDGNTKLEFLESYATTLDGEYSSWRAVKKGNRWTFYALRSSGWELFDTAIIEASKIGIALNGKPSSSYSLDFVPLAATRALLCESDTLIVGNTDEGCRIELWDADSIVDTRIVPQGNMGVEFPLPSIPFTGILKVFNSTGTFIGQSSITEFYGGDIYLNGPDLDIEWEGVSLSEVDFTDMKQLRNGFIEEKMYLVNNTPSIVTDSKIAVQRYKDEFGSEWTDVAPDVSGVPGTYGIEVILGDISIGQKIPFWVRIENRDPTVFRFAPAYFALDITHN